MSIKILTNCAFDSSKIQTLWVGSRTTGGTSIIFPIEYTTVSGSNDSIIKVENWDYQNSTVTIGGQAIQINEITNLGDNITFSEQLVINQNGKNYVKSLSFTIPKLTTFLVNQLKEFVITSDGLVSLAPTIALLIDENQQNLIIGWDKALYLSTTDLGLGDGNQITLTYSSQSPSRARAFEVV